MQVNCINCGHKFDLGKNYDDYEGLVKCPTCRFLLDIRSEEGCLKRVRAGMMFPMPAAPVSVAGQTPAATSDAGAAPVAGSVGPATNPGLTVAPEPPPLREAA
jgi:hypothetical protein